MQKIISALNEVNEINRAYQISNEKIEELQYNISEAKVCIPIIGKFSSGKSALVNTILGYNKPILKTDITPETAIPAEISYTDEEDVVIIEKNDGTAEIIAVSEYRSYEADAETVKCARLYLRNNYLGRIKDVMIVDMPGFESGFEIHNKAIDNYLPNSLAYIIAVPSDDMIIRSSVGNILKELCLHDMPICVAITKYDKRNDGYEEMFANLKETLRRYVGNREIKYCCTSSFSGDAEELEEYLEDIQEQSQEILSRSFVSSVLVIIENTESYLKTTLENSQLSESELSIKEDTMNRELENVENKFNSEKSNFDLELKGCVDEIKNDVQRRLEVEESTLVTMALNGQDISEHINNVVRSAVTQSVQSKFNAKIERYIKRVSDCINGDELGNINIPVNISMEKLNKTITNSIVAVLTGILIGPITGIITGLIMLFRSNKKKEEKKQQIINELRSNVFPRIIMEIEHKISQEVARIVLAINSSIENDFKTHKETLEKAMADLRSQIDEENEKKKNLGIDIRNDLARLQEIKETLA